MGQIADEFRSQCCGNLCDDKNALAIKIAVLEQEHETLEGKYRVSESRCATLRVEADEYNRLRANKEAFAKQVFMAGRKSVLNNDCCDLAAEKDWLNYKVEAGL